MGLDDLIKEYERNEMERKIYKLIPSSWHAQMKLFTEDEFTNTALRDGEMIKAIDELAAFLEAYLALENGIQNQDLKAARKNLPGKYKAKVIAGVDFGRIYRQFS